MKITAERETGHGGGVLFSNGAASPKFLWIKRSANGDYPGYWCCPGGGIEDHETIEQGVRREVREELGYDGDYELIHMARISTPGFTYHNHLATVEEFEPVLNDEHTDYVWSRTPPQPLHPGLAQAIDEHIKRWIK